MPTLIEQIQLAAVDDAVPVTTLLRRAKLAAAKLSLGKIEDWINYELIGYDNEVPNYRILEGQPKAYNPYNGWMPLLGEGVEKLTTRHIQQSISELEDLLRRSEGKGLYIPFPPALAAALDKRTNFPWGQYALEIDQTQIVGVIHSVRNAVLDWSISLDRSEVKGVDFSFTSDEITRAKEVTMNWTIGSIGNMTGNIGSGNTTGDISVGSIDIRQAGDLIEKVRHHMPALIEEGVPEQPLIEKLSLLQAECDQAKPNQRIVKNLLTDLRSVVSGAGGSLVSEGVLALIAKLLGS